MQKLTKIFKGKAIDFVNFHNNYTSLQEIDRKGRKFVVILPLIYHIAFIIDYLGGSVFTLLINSTTLGNQSLGRYFNFSFLVLLWNKGSYYIIFYNILVPKNFCQRLRQRIIYSIYETIKEEKTTYFP